MCTTNMEKIVVRLFGGCDPAEESKGAVMSRVKEFLRSEDGPTATEYAVMLALIIIVALAAITTLGTTVQGIFTNVNDGLPDGSGGGS
jgi:pilus assembly protein Flp/PilA